MTNAKIAEDLQQARPTQTIHILDNSPYILDQTHWNF